MAQLNRSSQITLANPVILYQRCWSYNWQIRHTKYKEKVEAKSPEDTPTYLAISRPGQRSTLGWLCLAAGTDNFLLQFIHNDLALQVLGKE